MTSCKPVLCYACALRMSTIPLSAVFPVDKADESPPMRLSLIPPPSMFCDELAEQQRLSAAINEVRRSKETDGGISAARVILTNYHPIFDIVYEVDQVSLVKCEETETDKSKVNQHLWDLMKKPPTFGTSKVGHTYKLTDGFMALLSSKESSGDERLCIACRGLYQFLDSFIAHVTGESVRRSPYFDSTKISANINVPRCISFLWLAVATVFLKGAALVSNEKNKCKKTVKSSAGMFPEEYASFKDLYTPDVRARVMSKVSEPEYVSVQSSNESQKRSRSLTDIHTDDKSDSCGVERCTQGFGYSHNSEGIIIDIDVRCPLFEPLTGEGDFEPNMELLVATERYRDHALMNAKRETDTIDNNRGNNSGNKWVSKRHGRNNQKTKSDCDFGVNGSIFPKDWCTNKSLSLGCPLPVSIIEEYMFDYLDACDPLWQRYFKITEGDKDGVTAYYFGTCAEDEKLTESGNDNGKNMQGRKLVLKRVSSLEGKNYIAGHLAPSDTQESVIKRCPLEICVDIPSTPVATHKSHSSTMEIGASIIITVRHANLYLIGNYCKYSRGMSQSPWFADGKRIGGDTNNLSLQECIVSPMLPLFFPRNGVPSSIAPSGTSAAKEINRGHTSSQFHGNLHKNTSTINCEDTATNSVDTHFSKKEHLRVCKALYNQPREAQTDADKNTTEIEESDGRDVKIWTSGVQTKYAGTPLSGVDPVRVALQEVEGYGHYKFHTAGREDIDVRMLGSGRPFVIEMISPEREFFTDKDLRALEVLVMNDTKSNQGGNVVISNLRYTTPDITVTLSKHSIEKRKVYRCVVYSSRAILSDSDPLLLAACSNIDLEISQLTPLRVLHRRSLLNRRKIIHSIQIQRTNQHWLVCTLETQAGAYVKEFIHGDMGRTIPNIGTLLNTRADIIQLDVLGMSDLLSGNCEIRYDDDEG